MTTNKASTSDQPGTGSVALRYATLPLAVAATQPPPDEENAKLFADARTKLPHASPWQAAYDAGDTRFALLVKSPELVTARPREAVFFPAADGMAEAASPQRVGTTSEGLVIESTTGWKMKTSCRCWPPP